MPQSKKSSSQPCLFYADSESDADVYYLSGIFIPDAFALIHHRGKSTAILSQLEFDRARRASRLDRILSFEELRGRAVEQFEVERPRIADIIAVGARELGLKAFEVPYNFPAGLAEGLRGHGLAITVSAEALVPQRLQKSDTEARAIRKANDASAAGLRAAERALKAATIVNGRLKLDGKPLTSERLRFLVDVACLEAGAAASLTICAGGSQACDPHERGSGPLRANELIIVDVFPRASASGYHGDMTRTFLKGRPSEAQKALVETVRLAQFAALEAVKPGVKTATVHAAVEKVFADGGYETGLVDGRRQGFIHSTGHGLGLEVHEAPRLSPNSDGRLSKGMVFTVEPGLYYPGIGGCRFEDVVRVETGGYEPLSKYPYNWCLK